MTVHELLVAVLRILGSFSTAALQAGSCVRRAETHFRVPGRRIISLSLQLSNRDREAAKAPRKKTAAWKNPGTAQTRQSPKLAHDSNQLAINKLSGPAQPARHE